MFWQDIRHAVGIILQNPGFSALAVLVLAPGIGANTAVFLAARNSGAAESGSDMAKPALTRSFRAARKWFRAASGDSDHDRPWFRSNP